MNIFDVIRAPKMSEKTLSLKEEENQFAFEVDPRANKIQIKESVEKAFKVSVLKVRTMNVRAKKKASRTSCGTQVQLEKSPGYT